MKRSPLRPGTKPLKRTPLSRSARPPHHGTRSTPRKPLKQTRHRKCWAHLRDPAFKAWVREQGCILAASPRHACKGRIEFAHIIPEGRGGADRGNGVGACGLAAHREGSKSLHFLGPADFADYWNLNLEQVAADLLTRYERENWEQ